MVVLNDANDEIIKMPETTESEKKRLESLRHKKEAFKTKELIVQNALKNLDQKSNSNKIIFDEDIDEREQTVIKGKVKKRKNDLFDDDDNDEVNETLWDESKFQLKENKSKFSGHTFTTGNDKRFKLDERFMENDNALDEDVTTQGNDEPDLKKEKELELDILENILGQPVTSKSKSTATEVKFAKKGMIRYDPTKDNHKEYEIDTETQNVTKKKVEKKKKVKKSPENTTEDPPIEVSKDIYFSVSESLTKSLKEPEQFSLLDKYGTAGNNEKEEVEYHATTIEPSQPSKFQFDFKSKNPFKYDSSDDEHDSKEVYEINESQVNDVLKDTNKFFFDANDTRFNEAINFFSKEVVPDDTFKNLRHELKQIIRSKIRNNIKKAQPFGRKRSIKRLTRKTY